MLKPKILGTPDLPLMSRPQNSEIQTNNISSARAQTHVRPTQTKQRTSTDVSEKQDKKTNRINLGLNTSDQ